MAAAGREGSIFGRGFDPLRMEPRHPVIDYHYTGNSSNFNQWASPRSDKPFKLPDEVYIYDIPSSEMVSETQVFENISTYMKYQVGPNGSP
jgi:hypothetical protein